MERRGHRFIPLERAPLTARELVAGLIALACLSAAVWQVHTAPVAGGLLMLAAAALLWLLGERVSTRHALSRLADGLRAADAPGKVESAGLIAAARLDQALNQAIQRRREEAARAATAAGVAIEQQHVAMVVTLAVGLRLEPGMAYTLTHLTRLTQVVQRARKALGEELLARLEGDGTVLLVIRVAPGRPVTASMQRVLAVARDLATDDRLRFGLSCGDAALAIRPNAAPLVIGAPLEDAARLARMAVAWHEYQMLCTEPVALLARTLAGQRTDLRLTHPGAPALPVYALDLHATAMARSA